MKLTQFTSQNLQDFFSGGANTLKLNRAVVDALNVFPVPDGDTGTNMSLTISAAVKEIKSTTADDIRLVAKELAHGALMGARGNSGVIFSQIIRGISQGLNSRYASPTNLAKALKKGADLAYQSVMKPVEGTVLTVIREMADAAIKAAYKSDDCLEVLEAAVAQGEVTLAQTPQLLPSLKKAGVVDAGGKGLILIFQGGIAALKGETVPELETEVVNTVQPKTEECEFGYCTEMIIKGNKLSIQEIRGTLALLGDSLLVVGDENNVKVHIHTLSPGAVLEYAVKLGTLHDIKIDNMSDQHQENDLQEVKKPLAVVAVASGHGMKEIFSSLGVDIVVLGGQSMNPSTEDLLKAVKMVNAEEVIVLPNNKNIIPAAEQLKGLSDQKIHIVPTKNLLQGISAMTLYDGDKAAAFNIERMSGAYAHLTSIEITYAVRDTVVNNLQIKTGDILALIDGMIEITGLSREAVLFEALEKSITEDHEIVTVFYGEGIEEAVVEEIQQEFAKRFPDIELEVHFGGQPIYHYLASVE